MNEQPQLLIIGPATPSRANAAGVLVQAALYFSHKARVTMVISNHAPPTTGIPASISVIRERDLRNLSDQYRNAKRLYILDDSYESLFALNLLKEAPAPWINADPTLHNLVHAHYRLDTAYPENYFHYMESTLGKPGWHIAHSLSGGTRVSEMIASEIKSFDAITEFAPLIEQSNATLSLPVAPAPQAPRRNKENCFDIVTIGESIANSAVETLNALGTGITLHQLSGSEPDLASYIEAATCVCLLDKTHQLAPAALTHALHMGKAIITAGQPWTKHLPANIHLNIPHSKALHHLVAAIASVAGNSETRQWLEKNTLGFSQTLNVDAAWSECTQAVLSANISPLKLKASATKEHKSLPGHASEHAQSTDTLLPSDGPKQPYALIGAVPAQAFVTKLFPAIDWNKSPRFATPELTEVLCNATGKTAPVVLALLGYESLLVETDNSSPNPAKTPHHMPRAFPWPAICDQLKEIQNAITFDCDIAGIPKARSLTPHDTNAPEGLEINFASGIHKDINRQPSNGFLKRTGTYWQLNQAEHRIDCILISGIPGRYKLSLTPSGTLDNPFESVAFMVTDAHTSSLMAENKPAIVNTDIHGVIQFSLSAVHPVNHYPLTYKQLLKTLASIPLYLEWCSHG